jgi:hypothetical protein
MYIVKNKKWAVEDLFENISANSKLKVDNIDGALSQMVSQRFYNANILNYLLATVLKDKDIDYIFEIDESSKFTEKELYLANNIDYQNIYKGLVKLDGEVSSFLRDNSYSFNDFVSGKIFLEKGKTVSNELRKLVSLPYVPELIDKSYYLNADYSLAYLLVSFQEYRDLGYFINYHVAKSEIPMGKGLDEKFDEMFYKEYQARAVSGKKNSGDSIISLLDSYFSNDGSDFYRTMFTYESFVKMLDEANKESKKDHP